MSKNAFNEPAQLYIVYTKNALTVFPLKISVVVRFEREEPGVDRRDNVGLERKKKL